MTDRALLSRAVDLHATGHASRDRGRMMQARRLYEELRERHPTNELGGECLLYLARLVCDLSVTDPTESTPCDRDIAIAAEAVITYPCGVSWAAGHAAQGELLAGLAHLYRRVGRYAEAATALEAAIALAPVAEDGLRCLLLDCVRRLGGFRVREYFAALAAADLAAGTPSERGTFAALALGNYAAAWPALDDVIGRWRPRAGYALPQWTGGSIAGTLLLDSETRGFGDVLNLARWLPSVQTRAGQVVLRCQPELVPLLENQFAGVRVIGHLNQLAGAVEAWTWLYSVPQYCGLDRPTDVPPAPYLRPRTTFRPLAGTVRVGLCWAGSGEHAHDFKRSSRLTAWDAVLRVTGVTFYSLQVGPPSGQLAGAPVSIMDLSPELLDWQATAAAVAELDLVVTVDTAVAHLAGALGVPVWICLGATHDWLYGLEGATTPWYGSARLFRPAAGDASDQISGALTGDAANSVFRQVAVALAERVAASVEAA